MNKTVGIVALLGIAAFIVIIGILIFALASGADGASTIHAVTRLVPRAVRGLARLVEASTRGAGGPPRGS